MPYRVQLKRTKGWKMPENTVKVDRSTRFGNPFTGPMAVSRFRRWLEGNMSTREFEEYHSFVRVSGVSDRQVILALLPKIRGKNLACWCELSKAGEEICHADVLLDLANKEPT